MKSADAGPHSLIVCTAGHIDHGKSRLIYALTGVDPDRLPEERARGMTIDLGFAHSRIDNADLWFVDVPGHERFIRNMVAGAGSVDLAMLVVAADDSVMPQTREHAELLRLLGIERCLLVITKIDLVDADWVTAVEQEARGLLDETDIEVTRSIRTSAETGDGISSLRTALRDLARNNHTRHASSNGWFRLAIDRAFAIAGRGAVVTGSITHGSVHAGDELELWPPGRRVRIRGLHADREARDVADGRMRLGLNLAGVALDELARGQQLATPSYLSASRRIEARLMWLRMHGRTPRKSLSARLLIGTREVMVRVILPAAHEPDANYVGYAQIEADEPLMTAHGDRFALRNVGATRTLGGGIILRPVARRWTRREPLDKHGLADLESDQPRARLSAVLTAQRWPEASLSRLAAGAGLYDAVEADKLLRELCTSGRAARLPDGPPHAVMMIGVLRAVGDDLVVRMNRRLEENPRWPGVPRREWAGWMPRACPPEWRDGLAALVLERDERLIERGGSVVLAGGDERRLPPQDEVLYQLLTEEFRAAGLKPPGENDLTCRTPRNARRIRELIALAEARGVLRRFAPDMWLHTEAWEQAVESVRHYLGARGAATLSEIREHLGTTRKYMVPLAEYLDSQKITRRRGDQRTLVSRDSRDDKSGGAD